MKKKIIWISISITTILLLIISSVWLSSPKEEQNAPPLIIEEAVVTRGSLRVSVEATGRVVPKQEVEIKCKASGEIIKLPVDVSDRVKKDQLLVQLDPIDEERNVLRSEVSLAVSRARLAQTELALKVAMSELTSEQERVKALLQSAVIKADDAQARLTRQEKLREKQIASEEELGAARAANAQAAASLQDALMREKDLKSKEVQLESKRHDITIATQAVKADKIALDSSRKRLSETTVNSPIDGIVVTRNVQVGQIIASGVSNVGGGTSVLVLADLNQIYVLVSVDESDIGQLKVGQKASITADAYPEQHFTGKVVRVATKGSVNSNVVTFEVKVEVIGKTKNLLKPEMTANVEIITLDKRDALLLPVAAVQLRGTQSFVNIKDGSQEGRQTEVQVGKSDGENIEIVKGLKENDTIIFPDKAASERWRKENSAAIRDKKRKAYMQKRMLKGNKK